MNPPECNEYDYINFLIAAQRVFSSVEASKPHLSLRKLLPQPLFLSAQLGDFPILGGLARLAPARVARRARQLAARTLPTPGGQMR